MGGTGHSACCAALPSRGVFWFEGCKGFNIGESRWDVSLVDRSDLYVVLQVDPGAETDVIKAAYRTLAAKHHPDVGGSGDRMAELNRAWSVLSDRSSRAAYDQQRRLRIGGDRWDAYSSPGQTSSGPSWGRVLEFGRFAGWSIPEVARSDPNYLEWLARTPNGRRYQGEIEDALGGSTRVGDVAVARAHQRSRLRWR
jgi:curved DNA-binding protein CbpA